MERKELKFETTLPADGTTWTRAEKFNVYPRNDGRWKLEIRNVYDMGGRAPDSESSMSYLVQSWEEFEADWRENMQKQANEANKNVVWQLDRDARLKRYELSPVKALIVQAFDDAFIQQLFEEAIQEKDGVLDGIASYLEGHTRRPVDVRKRLKPIISEAKESIREEYPEEYREEDDKEDFYADHASDIAEFLANSF